jgi:hypothetical protein
MSNLINTNDKRFYATASSATAVESFPSQDFYRTMRHSELTAYRMVVKSIVMHHQQQQQQNQDDDSAAIDSNTTTTIQLTRAQTRLLEDLEAELVIPQSRREVEIQEALRDVAVSAVRTSGVANRRPLHFDGINDVPVVNNNNNIGDDDTDDDGAIIAVSQRGGGAVVRKGRSGNNDSQVGAAKPSNSANAQVAKQSKPLDAATLTQLAKLYREVPALCAELVVCSDAASRTKIQIELKKKENEIIRIREKAIGLCASQG